MAKCFAVAAEAQCPKEGERGVLPLASRRMILLASGVLFGIETMASVRFAHSKPRRTAIIRIPGKLIISFLIQKEGLRLSIICGRFAFHATRK